MRIRKLFMLSSLSDPQLNRSSPLSLVQQPHQETNHRSHPSDQNLLIRSAKASSWVFSSTHKDMEGEEAREERSEEGDKSNDITKKGNILDSGLLQETGSSNQGKLLVPLPPKKRRSFEGDNETEKQKKKTKAKMKSKTNKKCVQLLPNEEDEETNKGINMGNSDGAKKKAKRVNVIMEGSRCSRVNGRGWRCCQQTLVGYSLCEHHLGKGRLRSIASVRNRAMANRTPTSAPKQDESARLSPFAGKLGQKMVDKDEEDEDEDEPEEKPLMIRKKRMKIGMVKARSISSLLGQTNNAVIDLNDNDKKSSVV